MSDDHIELRNSGPGGGVAWLPLAGEAADRIKALEAWMAEANDGLTQCRERIEALEARNQALEAERRSMHHLIDGLCDEYGVSVREMEARGWKWTAANGWEALDA